MVKPVQTGLFRGVDEDHGSIVHEPARRDRAVLGVFDRGMGSAGRYSHP